MRELQGYRQGAHLNLNCYIILSLEIFCVYVVHNRPRAERCSNGDKP
jgi:hypothetical protein